MPATIGTTREKGQGGVIEAIPDRKQRIIRAINRVLRDEVGASCPKCEYQLEADECHSDDLAERIYQAALEAESV
jgi:hypothetical protein